MCDIIDRIESFGVDYEQLAVVLKKRPGPLQGNRSEASISLIVLGVVEAEWATRATGDHAATPA